MELNEKFEAYSNAELLRIIHNPADYQAQAVETAKIIFAGRQLSASEIEAAENEYEIERQQKQIAQDKAKNIGKSVFDYINPFQKKTPTTVRTIAVISFLLGAHFLFRLYKHFGMLKFLFTGGYAEWDLTMAISFLPLILIPVAAILLYTGKKAGWLLSAIVLTDCAVSEINQIFLKVYMKSSGIEALDSLFPQFPTPIYLLVFLFWSGIICVISREKIRSVYSIRKRTMILTISIVILYHLVLALVLIISFFVTNMNLSI